MRALGLLLLVSGCAARLAFPRWAEPPPPFGAVSEEILDPHGRPRATARFAARDNPAPRFDERRAVVERRAALSPRRRHAAHAAVARLAPARCTRLSAGDADGQAEKTPSAYAESGRWRRATTSCSIARRRRSRRPRSSAPPSRPTCRRWWPSPRRCSTGPSCTEPPTLLGQRDWLNAAAVRAVELDRSAGFGAPDRVLGAVLNAAP